MKLNLGCGDDYKKGWINLDVAKDVRPDIVYSLEGSLPFKSRRFDYVLCNHILEHIENFNQLMREIHRVCKDNAIVEIEVPYYKNKIAYTDPTHKRFFTERSFEYFTNKGYGGEFDFYNDIKFEIIERKRVASGNWSLLPHKILGFLDRFLWGVFSVIRVKLRILK